MVKSILIHFLSAATALNHSWESKEAHGAVFSPRRVEQPLDQGWIHFDVTFLGVDGTKWAKGEFRKEGQTEQGD